MPISFHARCRFTWACIALGVAASAFAAEEPARKKLPAPTVEQVTAMLQTVGGIYKTQLDAAKSPEQKAKLAAKMLADAEGTKDDAVARYVLYRAARKLASASGNLHVAVQAVEQTCNEYAVDGYQAKLEMVSEALPLVKTPEDQYLLARYSRRTLNEAVAENHFEVALPFANAALEASKLIHDADINRQYLAERERIAKLVAAYEKVKPALEALEKNPADPAANTAVGKFTSFVKRDFAKGLPMLALGDDATFKELAARDLKAPTDAAEQLALANGWYDAAQGQEGAAKNTLLARAGYWYRLVASGLTGLNRTRVDNRLKEADAVTNVFRAGEWVELLDHLDLERCRVRGQWTWRATDLYLAKPHEERCMVALPVVPEGSYELSVRFTCDEKRDLASMYFPLGKNKCMLRLNETKNNFSAIEMIRLKVAWQTENPSHTKGIDYTPGKAITVTTRVEPEGENVHFTVTVDGKPYIKWGGPKDVLYTYSGWNALPGNRLGIAISSESLTVHSARFKLLSGSAHLPE